ncbi:hypothetical protein QEO94_04820 [Kingella negevensis]|uniref:hypothetical protein n=1 Tax=Kingella negevensis TaxID=1522312 RepID=UPI002543E3B8|nr:hypothetical protein [Kingella negevensis]WII94111.1 hypothetical protein QEO94_04820 [Kingella negevensis]
MDEEMMVPLLLAVGVVCGLVAFLVKNKQKSGDSNSKKGRGSPSAKKKAKGKKSKNDVDDEPIEKTDESSEAAEENWEEWGSATASANVVDDTKVSVQDVDALTEFNVYKQFGYYDKAAASLAAYMEKTQRRDSQMANDLVSLWLQAKDVEAAASAIAQQQDLLSTEELTEYIKQGLALDENHLGLRVLAETKLGWTVKKTTEEIGEKAAPQQAAKPEAPTRRKSNAEIEAAAAAAALAARKPLIAGNGVISNITNDEKGAVLAFMQPEQGVKLLKDSLSYDAAIKYLNKAIRSSDKPASLLIDALTLDYHAKNINGFAGHLWNLYYSLGKYGRQVKERMLGWGYSMGQHPVFEQLENNPNEAILRDLGIQQGWLDGGSLKKARYQALVTEKADVSGEPRTAAERILKEAESLLMYGQLEGSMEMLEKAIIDHPQESQLYITLFDLYERAEEWERLENLLQELRGQVQTLPEEVVLAMSQLLQRLNNGSFGH